MSPGSAPYALTRTCVLVVALAASAACAASWSEYRPWRGPYAPDFLGAWSEQSEYGQFNPLRGIANILVSPLDVLVMPFVTWQWSWNEYYDPIIMPIIAGIPGGAMCGAWRVGAGIADVATLGLMGDGIYPDNLRYAIPGWEYGLGGWSW